MRSPSHSLQSSTCLQPSHQPKRFFRTPRNRSFCGFRDSQKSNDFVLAGIYSRFVGCTIQYESKHGFKSEFSVVLVNRADCGRHYSHWGTLSCRTNSGGRRFRRANRRITGFGLSVAKGTRDIVSGLLLIALLWLRVGRRVLAAFIGVAALIPVGDFINVSLNVGLNNPLSLAIHGWPNSLIAILQALAS